MGVTTNWSNISVVSFALIAISIVLGLWAIFTVGVFKVRIVPDLQDGAQLVTGGPYKLVRHPMYSSLIILCSGLVLSNPTWYMFLGYILLLIDLVFKLRYEEKKLLLAFSEYKNYKNGTYYFFPFVY